VVVVVVITRKKVLACRREFFFRKERFFRANEYKISAVKSRCCVVLVMFLLFTLWIAFFVATG
jgi:uncharacterized membrane protein